MFSLSFSSQFALLLFFSLIGCGKAKKEDSRKKICDKKQSATKPQKPNENKRAKTAERKGSADQVVKREKSSKVKKTVQQFKKPEKKKESKNNNRDQSPEKSDVHSKKDSQVRDIPSNASKVKQVDAKAEKPISKKSEEPKPRDIPLGKKEMEIAKGKKLKKNAYPTMDDVKSDWKSEDEDDKPPSNQQAVKPKVISLDAKRKLIAKGQKRNKNEYPTMDDVKSDWKSESEEPKSKNMNSLKKKTSKEQQKDGVENTDNPEVLSKDRELSKHDDPSKQDDSKHDETKANLLDGADEKKKSREKTPVAALPLPNAKNVEPSLAKNAPSVEKKKSSESKKGNALPDEPKTSEKEQDD